MRRTALLLSACLLAAAATAWSEPGAGRSLLARSVALARSADCFRDQVANARRAGNIVGRAAASDNGDGTYNVTVSVCPPCTALPEPCLTPCTAIIATVDPVAGVVTCW